MSRIRFQSKANGLLLLRGRWLKAMAILLLIMLLLLGFSALEDAYRTFSGVPFQQSDGSFTLASLLIEIVFTLLVLLFIPPLIAGQAEWYWSLTDVKPKGVGEVFGWFGSFKLYLKSVGVALNIFFRFLFWAILTCTAPIAMIVAAYYYYYPPKFLSDYIMNNDAMMYCIIMTFGVVLLLAAVFLLCFISMKYFLAVFLMVEDSSRGVREIVKTSLRYTKGQRWELMKFCLTYLFWFIQLIFIFPALFVLPYFNSSSTVLAKHIIYSQRAMEKTDKVKIEDPVKT
jgi:uncharacterized membrane protein